MRRAHAKTRVRARVAPALLFPQPDRQRKTTLGVEMRISDELVKSTSSVEQTKPAGKSSSPDVAGSFAAVLNSAIETITETNKAANTAVTGMLNKTVDVHDAMIALHEEEEALEISLAIRNKFVQAYQEIMRMPL